MAKKQAEGANCLHCVETGTLSIGDALEVAKVESNWDSILIDHPVDRPAMDSSTLRDLNEIPLDRVYITVTGQEASAIRPPANV